MNATKDVMDILKGALDDPNWGPIAAEALRIVEDAVLKESNSSTSPQSSKEVGSMQVNRKRDGFYKHVPIGFDQTITALLTEDVDVRLSYVETDRGYVVFWLSEHPVALRGLLVLNSDDIGQFTKAE